MKVISELAGAFVDGTVASDEYLFSYKNNQQHIFEFYKKKMVLIINGSAKCWPYAAIGKVTIQSTVKSVDIPYISIWNGQLQEDIAIDGRRGKFLDVFPLYRFISRRVFMAKRENREIL